MKNYKNEGEFDRLVRVILAELFLLGGFFWFSGLSYALVMTLGIIILVTALFGFCGVYGVLGINTCPISSKKTSVITKIVFVVVFLLIAFIGSYYSNFFTKKFFLEDYSRMNNFYKQTLFYTGQNKRVEAIDNYNKLVQEYSIFSSKYSKYQPYILRSDKQFNLDLEKVQAMINGYEEKINTGDLKMVHLDMEEIRPIFQDILKRNGFSILAVSLVDFHDVMEEVIEFADAKDVVGVEKAYTEADLKLRAVEAEVNDVEIQNIRQKLEEILSLAKAGEVSSLSSKASELKSAFVKVYLKRG